MATTVPDGIWTPDDSTAYNLPVDLAAMADTVQSALNNVRTSGNQQFYGPASDIGAVTGMKRGDTYQESDGNFITWRYSGTNWITDETGSYLIRPSAVTGSASASIDSRGRVQLAAVSPGSTIKIEGLFSSRFLNYQVRGVWPSKPSVGGSPRVTGLVGSTPITATSYSTALQGFIGGTRVDVQGTGEANFGEAFIPGVGTAGSGMAEIFNPNGAGPTFILAQTSLTGGVTGVSTSSNVLNASNQLTGLQIYLGPGAPWTATLSFYGLS